MKAALHLNKCYTTVSVTLHDVLSNMTLEQDFQKCELLKLMLCEFCVCVCIIYVICGGVLPTCGGVARRREQNIHK